MTEWFTGLDALAKTYWIITLIGSLFFLFVLVTTFIGGDVDELGDSDFDGGIDFQFLSFKNIVGFITIFGWSGLASMYSDNSDMTTLIISSVCGLIMMLIMAALFYFLRNTGESGTLNLNNAIGIVGEVYLPIKANRSSIGKVSIKVQGSLRELEALTDEKEDLKSGNVIKVIAIISDEILLVEKFKN
jgi:hypothetical protein